MTLRNNKVSFLFFKCNCYLNTLKSEYFILLLLKLKSKVINSKSYMYNIYIYKQYISQKASCLQQIFLFFF